MLTENKFSKYLLYAGGEIFLVFIGILLALQFNNWNEEKKQQNEVNRMLIDIENDLINNYKMAEVPIDFYKRQDSLAKLILYDKLTTKDYLENHALSFFTLNWDSYLPVTKNINSFVADEKLASPKYKPIIQALKKLQLRRETLNETWTNLEEYIDQTTYYFEDYPWTVKYDSISSMQRTQFMLTNQGYKNKVMLYWAISQNYLDKMTRFRSENMSALATLKRVKYDFTTNQIKQMYDEFGLIPYKEYKCDIKQKELPSLKSLRTSMLIGNLSDTIVKLKITNNIGQTIGAAKLLPNEMSTLFTEYFGIDGDYNHLIESLDENGNCLQKYGATENGYLIIE